jgi:ABC-type phosphate/phosphonate transport system substrate-binding protein
MGAVLYAPQVSVIWEIICKFCDERGVKMDTVFYTNYELQVEALAKGSIDVAWNSPLAYLDSVRALGGKCRAIAMRDTDRDRVSHLVVKKDGGIDTIADLKGKTIGFGAADSPQATLIPKEHLRRMGLPESGYTARGFDVLVGKHGDHIGGERDALKALQTGEVDASWMIDLNWSNWTKDGTISPERYKIVETTPTFDHCVFTVREGFDKGDEKALLDALFAMDYENPTHRHMMDLEGLKKWLPARTTGFELLSAATKDRR